MRVDAAAPARVVADELPRVGDQAVRPPLFHDPSGLRSRVLLQQCHDLSPVISHARKHPSH